MEPTFDKNIDALLRQPHLRGAPSAEANHLDADQIAAFAANAVPEPARHTYIAHFADCGDCRGSLAAVISLSTDDRAEAAAAAPAILRQPEKEPWYRGLLRGPGLAFSMGALVLVFTGFIGYVVLTNMGGGDTAVSTQNSTMVGETARGPSADDPGVMANEDFSAAVSNTANMAMNANRGEIVENNVADNAAANRAVARQDSEVANAMTGRDLAASLPAPPPPRPAEDAAVAQASPAREERESSIQQQKVENLPRPAKAPAITVAPPAGETRERAAARMAENDASEAKRAAGPPARRVEGGKSFELRGNVWYDTAYSGQSLTDVRRGTDAYRALDSGIRAIADKFTGTVVILWKEKGYRVR